MVASFLSLEISKVFDNVSYERLIHNLRKNRILIWISQFVKIFLEERTTAMVLAKFKGEQISNTTGIPQGSPLSPIPFLYFVSTLLPKL